MSTKSSTGMDAAPHVRLADCSVTAPAVGGVKTLKQSLLRQRDTTAVGRRLLQDIDLEATSGERIGVVGRNGAGKTTLLRLIAGIYPHSRGMRHVRGTVAPVLALGGGLDPELSLQANVRLGLIHSNRSALYSADLVKSILDFAELSDRANDPMRRLSAGLQARFAFSLSIYQVPDILILDEIFAVGDAGFVEKARAKMLHLLDASPILFMASHNENEIRDICSRALLIDEGQIVMDGDPASIFADYHAILASD